MVHYRLPIINSSSLTMMATNDLKKAVLKGRYAGTDKKTGVSCPDYGKLPPTDTSALARRSVSSKTGLVNTHAISWA